MASALLSAMEELVGRKLEMTTAAGGKVVVFANCRSLSVRRVRHIAAKHGKFASFQIADEPCIVFEEPGDDGVAKPGPVCTRHGTGDCSILLSTTPDKIVKLDAKSAGSTDVYVVHSKTATLSSTAADEWLKLPKSLDIHVGKGELRMLVAQPSLSTLSIGRLLRSGQLKVGPRRKIVGKTRRPVRRPKFT